MAASSTPVVAAAPAAPSAPAPSQNPAKPQLPPPQTFDILPPLHELLSRIDHSSVDPNTLANGSTDNHNSSTSDETGASYTDQQPLDPKDLPAEVVAIKARIRRALRELEKLPDMERTVAEQQAEIAELELRVRRQREVLRTLGEEAGSLAKGLG